MEQADGVILAAGLSRRAGCHKMALLLGEKTVIQRSVESMYDLAHQIYVVVGWQSDRIRELLQSYAKVELVRNEDFRSGMFSSVKVGIARVCAPRFFLLPGDYPFVGANVYKQMMAISGDIVIPTFNGKTGHPVLFHSRLVPEILAEPADGTLRDYVDVKGYATVEVADEGILLDIDTPEDCRAARARYETKPEARQTAAGTK